MRTCARTVLCVAVFAAPASAQFSVPLPRPRGGEEVRRQDYRRLFSAQLSKPARDSLLAGRTLNSLDTARANFCTRTLTDEGHRKECLETLTEETVRQWADGRGPRLTRVILPVRLPFRHSRAALANALRAAGVTEGLTAFARFAANISDDEAYVVTNVIRGLTGRAVFAVDYAAVVAKAADEETPEEREEAEDDKATLLRMINNGGTLVGRFAAPIHAWSGASVSRASAISFAGGVIGPLGQTDQLDAAGSVVGEFMSAVPIRALDGGEEQTAELVIGARAGYSRSDGPLLTDGSDKDVGYGQVAIGLRRNGDLSLSVLITQTEKDFRKVVPRLVVNFSAIR